MCEEIIEKLYKKGLFRDVLSKIKSKGKVLLNHIDFSFVNKLFVELKQSNVGRPPEYMPENKLKGILYCFASNIKKIRAMSRKLKETLAKYTCGFMEKTPSPSTISRFFRRLNSVIELIFQNLAIFAMKLGIYGKIFLIDTTSIEVDKNDPNGKWNYDSTKKSWYYGYGLELIIDWKTHLPVTAVFTNGKHVGDKEIQESITKMDRVKLPNILIGDGEFDTKTTHDSLMKRNILPIINYNSRNSREQIPFSFRTEEIVRNLSKENISLKTKQLLFDYKKRIEVEHSISMIKSLGLEKPSVMGYYAVKTHAFLILIYRLVIGIYKFNEDKKSNLRVINIEL